MDYVARAIEALKKAGFLINQVDGVTVRAVRKGGAFELLFAYDQEIHRARECDIVVSSLVPKAELETIPIRNAEGFSYSDAEEQLLDLVTRSEAA